MNRINEYDIEPGPWTDEHGTTLVVLDVVNHAYNTTANLCEALADPFVILRPLDVSRIEHSRYAYPLSIFKQKFTKQ